MQQLVLCTGKKQSQNMTRVTHSLRAAQEQYYDSNSKYDAIQLHSFRNNTRLQASKGLTVEIVSSLASTAKESHSCEVRQTIFPPPRAPKDLPAENHFSIPQQLNFTKLRLPLWNLPVRTRNTLHRGSAKSITTILISALTQDT